MPTTTEACHRRRERTATEDLFRAYRRTRDRLARDELIRRHLDLAPHLALRFRDRGQPVEDLEQVASMGLIGAVDRFDPDRGGRFSTFAVPTILGELKRYFRDKTWLVRPPRTTQELYLRVRDALPGLTQHLGHDPSVEEIAAGVGLSRDEVLDAIALRSQYRPVPIEHGEPNPEATTAVKPQLLGAPDPELDRSELRLELRHLSTALSPRDRELLRLRFGESLAQREIATRLGISQMHVSRLLSTALVRLAEHAAALDTGPNTNPSAPPNRDPQPRRTRVRS